MLTPWTEFNPSIITLETIRSVLSQPNFTINTVFHKLLGGLIKGTLLHIAVHNKDHGLICFLISHGSQVNFAAPLVDTPLYLAEDIRTFRLLLEYSADLEAATGGAIGLLIHAIYRNCYDIVKFLIELGIDVNSRAPDGKYKNCLPLHVAARQGTAEIVKLLLENNADINARDANFEPALIHALKNQNLEVFQLLVARGSNIHFTEGINGWTLLKRAVFEQNLHVVEHLLTLEEPHPDESETLLHFKLRHFPSLRFDSLLLDAGVDINVPNAQNLLPVEFKKLLRGQNLDIECHIIKLMAAGFSVAPRNVNALRGVKLQDFQVDCWREVMAMKMTKLSGNLVVFDVLKRPLHLLTINLRRTNLTQKIKEMKLSRHYPIYGKMLFFKLAKVCRRIKYLRLVEKRVEGMLCHLGIPYDFVRDLWKYFSNWEMEKLVL